MRFEYNINCDSREKLELVSKEIMDAYPQISKDDALKIAALDNPIDDKCSNDDKFFRYYLILLVIGERHQSFAYVFNDMLKIYSGGIQSDKLNQLMEEIIKFAFKERSSFPIISEVYE